MTFPPKRELYAYNPLLFLLDLLKGMKFVCSINSSFFETSSGWDLCFFGGECLPSADECKCPLGYGPDQTMFSETKNCAMPRMALEILFGCFLVLWLWIGWAYVRFASENRKKLRRIHTATTITHLALFVYMLWTTTINFAGKRARVRVADRLKLSLSLSLSSPFGVLVPVPQAKLQ